MGATAGDSQSLCIGQYALCVCGMMAVSLTSDLPDASPSLLFGPDLLSASPRRAAEKQLGRIRPRRSGWRLQYKARESQGKEDHGGQGGVRH